MNLLTLLVQYYVLAPFSNDWKIGIVQPRVPCFEEVQHDLAKQIHERAMQAYQPPFRLHGSVRRGF